MPAMRSNATSSVLLGDYFATHPFRHRAGAAAGLGGRARAAERAARRLRDLGNHDWWYDIEGVRAALRRVDIPAMENDAVLLGAPGAASGWPASATSSRIGSARSHFEGVDDLPGTLARIDTDDPVILLAHEPDIFPDVPERVALTLAGHTHGGQIQLPFVPPLWAPSEYGARFAYGHIVEEGRHMIVSGGLGCSARCRCASACRRKSCGSTWASERENKNGAREGAVSSVPHQRLFS